MFGGRSGLGPGEVSNPSQVGVEWGSLVAWNWDHLWCGKVITCAVTWRSLVVVYDGDHL